MLRVLIRCASPRRFYGVPTTCFRGEFFRAEKRLMWSYAAVLNRISHGTDSSHVWKIRSDLSSGAKNSTEFFTAAERIPHLSVTNSFGISFIYSTQTYLSPFKKKKKKKKTQKKCLFFTHGFLTNVFVTAYDTKHTINHLIQFRGNIFFFSCISFNRVIDLLFIVLLFLTLNIIGYHKMK